MKWLLVLWYLHGVPTVHAVLDDEETCRRTGTTQYDWHDGLPFQCVPIPLDMLAFDVLIYANRKEEWCYEGP